MYQPEHVAAPAKRLFHGACALQYAHSDVCFLTRQGGGYKVVISGETRWRERICSYHCAPTRRRGGTVYPAAHESWRQLEPLGVVLQPGHKLPEALHVGRCQTTIH